MKQSNLDNIDNLNSLQNVTDNSDGDSSSSRVKGSVKDRVLNFFYRKRLKIKLAKNRLVNHSISVQMNTHMLPEKKDNKINVIKDMRDLKKYGNKVIEVDLATETFDFDKYDYYLIEPVMKKGIDPETIKLVVEHTGMVKDSKEKLQNIKNGVTKIAFNLQYPKEHQENLSAIYLEVQNELDDLKYNLAHLPRKIDTKDLDGIRITDKPSALQDVKDTISYYESKLDDYLNDLQVVEVICKSEFAKKKGIEQYSHVKEQIIEEPIRIRNSEIEEELVDKSDDKNVDPTVIEGPLEKPADSKVSIDNINKYKLENKKLVIDKKSEALKAFNRMKVVQIKKTNEELQKEISDTKDFVNRMNKEVSKVTKEIEKVTRVTGYSRMISSCFRIATGILTLPFTGLNLFNIALGSNMINRGLHELRRGLETKSEIQVNYKYEDFTEKIRKTQDKVKLTEILITDSLHQINVIKNDVSYVDSETLEMLMKLERNLNEKLKQIHGINNTLTKQAEKNKIKLKKIAKKGY